MHMGHGFLLVTGSRSQQPGPLSAQAGVPGSGGSAAVHVDSVSDELEDDGDELIDWSAKPSSPASSP